MLALRLRSRSEQSFARKSSRRAFSLSPFLTNWGGASLFLLCWGIFLPTFSFSQVTPHSASYDEIASLIANRRLDSAVKLLNEFLAKSPNDVRAENLMGIALTAEGRLSEANRYFERATRHDPSFYPALKNLALNELRLNHPADAATHLEKVLQFSPWLKSITQKNVSRKPHCISSEARNCLSISLVRFSIMPPVARS